MQKDWKKHIFERDEVEIALIELEDILEKTESLEKAYEEYMNSYSPEMRQGEMIGIASYDLNKNNKIHIVLKKLALAEIEKELERECYEEYYDPEGRKKAILSLKKELLTSEVWGKEFEVNSSIKLILDSFVEQNEKTKTLEFDEIENHPLYARHYKDPSEKNWTIDFFDEEKDFYASICVPSIKKNKEIRLIVNQKSDEYEEYELIDTDDFYEYYEYEEYEKLPREVPIWLYEAYKTACKIYNRFA